jgi:UTP:GlnB (protein PII) uridylyltransferase
VVETADRPGLLVDLVKIISDININVQSGEFDTEVTMILQSVSVHASNHIQLLTFYTLVGATG